MESPGDAGNYDTVLRAADTRAGRFNLNQHTAEVHSTPSARNAMMVVPRTFTATVRAAMLKALMRTGLDKKVLDIACVTPHIGIFDNDALDI